MYNKIKNLLTLKMKKTIIYYFGIVYIFRYFKFLFKKNIFVMIAADYKNIGDAGITYAQVDILKEFYPAFNVVEIPLRESYSTLLALKIVTNKKDIISIIGGGNMGDLYCGIEEIRQFIVKKFNNNRIISFPQSFNFQEDNNSLLLKSAINIYNNHSSLTLFARDEISFNKMKKYFNKSNVRLMPDIVLTLDYSDPPLKREGVLFLLRNDKEGLFKKEIKLKIINYFNNKKYKVLISDTLYEEKLLSVEKRNLVFKELLKNIKKNNIVITDRLHGVIFCYITKTPCIAINSLNNKVKNAIDSYMLCDFIKFFEINELESNFQNNDNILEGLISTEQVLISNKTKEYRQSFREALKQ